MEITYNIWIKDTMEGYEFIYDSFEDINEAIDSHIRITRGNASLKSIIMEDLLVLPIHIDQYHLDYPHKRFDVTLEVDYGP